MINRKKQNGFTLVEMMISSAIGLIAMGGVISIFATSVKNSGENLKSVRLNQELRTIMDVMVRDVRRAGYWRNADGVAVNPFSNIAVSADQGCITYSYDVNETNPDVPLENEDNFGFKLIGTGVTYRTNSTTCDTDVNWDLISDTNAISITELTFNLETICSNLSDNAGTIDADCATAAPGDILSYMYKLHITLKGQIANDASVKYALEDSVSIRNAVPTEN